MDTYQIITDEFPKEEVPEYYDVIPEFNISGRLCNYHTGEGETVRVMAEEWERFNQMAGRQHEIVDGIVVFNPDLEPCEPDIDYQPGELEFLQLALIEQYEINLKLQEDLTKLELIVAELKERGL